MIDDSMKSFFFFATRRLQQLVGVFNLGDTVAVYPRRKGSFLNRKTSFRSARPEPRPSVHGMCEGWIPRSDRTCKTKKKHSELDRAAWHVVLMLMHELAADAGAEPSLLAADPAARLMLCLARLCFPARQRKSQRAW